MKIATQRGLEYEVEHDLFLEIERVRPKDFIFLSRDTLLIYVGARAVGAYSDDGIELLLHPAGPTWRVPVVDLRFVFAEQIPFWYEPEFVPEENKVHYRLVGGLVPPEDGFRGSYVLSAELGMLVTSHNLLEWDRIIDFPKQVDVVDEVLVEFVPEGDPD